MILVYIVTEIKCRKYDNIRVAGYKCVVESRVSNIGRRIGGVAIFIKNNIKVEVIRNILL